MGAFGAFGAFGAKYGQRLHLGTQVGAEGKGRMGRRARVRRRRYHPRQALPREHTRQHVADALALGAFGVRWAAERTLAHDAELRARATPTSRMGRRGARVRVTHMESYLKQFRGQAKGSSCVHASQRSTSGQPGECRLLSSPQRHARRRRGELRAHWDAGDRLERGQERQGQGIRREGAARVWFECLLHHASEIDRVAA